MLTRLLECYTNLLKDYIKSIDKKLKNRSKHRKIETLKEQIFCFSDKFIKKVFLINLSAVITEMKENGLEIFYDMEEQYKKTFTEEESSTKIFKTPSDIIETVPFALSQFQKDIEEHFDRAISQGSAISSKNSKIQARTKQLSKK